jgi:FkbM family methyltransferase
MKSALKKSIASTIEAIDHTKAGKYIYAQVIKRALGRSQEISHSGISLTFSTPNALNQYRADTFSTKEPETLEWIDAIPSGSILWDIGANVGLYSCYAAKKRGCRVFAFEPSVFNLELLAKNIHANSLTELVTIVPLPLSDKLAVNTLNMTNTEWGGALSTFGQDYGHDGRPMPKVFSFPTIGLSMHDAQERLNIPAPNFIKMDVDGIEHLILKGGASILNTADGVLIEINDQFLAQSDDASACLKAAGFTLREKRHADYFDAIESSEKYTYNQIWVK